jgi:hypothetical protein
VEATVSEFYKWHLHLLAQNKEPLLDDRATISKYASRALLGEIEKKLHSADGMEADYFIQAQDYLDDWESNISIARPDIQGPMATVKVVLGATRESRYKLALKLIREDGAWKIREVRRAD